MPWYIQYPYLLNCVYSYIFKAVIGYHFSDFFSNIVSSCQLWESLCAKNVLQIMCCEWVIIFVNGMRRIYWVCVCVVLGTFSYNRFKI
jgi:hypothetical protein